MRNCWDCGAGQFSGALFCNECGADLLNPEGEAVGPATTPVFEEGQIRPSSPVLQLVGQEIAPLRDVDVLQVVIATSGRRQTLMMEEDIVIGRADPARGVQPAIDLTADRGAELGVSRTHAIIRQTDEGPAIIDANSTNGTILNGRRLPPDLPYRLAHGDELHFGDVVMHVFFD